MLNQNSFVWRKSGPGHSRAGGWQQAENDYFEGSEGNLLITSNNLKQRIRTHFPK